MKKTVNINDFRDAFLRFDQYKNNFSYEGLSTLFEHLENMEDEIDQEFELDVIAICCDFVEYDSFRLYQEDYETNFRDLDELAEQRLVIRVEGTDRFILDINS